MSFITFDAAIITYHITKLYQFTMINSIIGHLHNIYQNYYQKYKFRKK